MKNQQFSLLAAVTLIFFGFTFGFFVGRNTSGDAILVSVPPDMQTTPAQIQETELEILFPIDLNTAGEEEIMALPGIGKTLTLRILAYRRERGRFFSLEDLAAVEGITDNMIDKIRDLVYVGG